MNEFRFSRFPFVATLLAATALLTIGASTFAESPPVTKEDFAEERVYSPYVGRAYPDQVLFGDMHFHTDLSFDAGLIGTSLTAHEGFRVAEPVPGNVFFPALHWSPLKKVAVRRSCSRDTTREIATYRGRFPCCHWTDGGSGRTPVQVALGAGRSSAPTNRCPQSTPSGRAVKAP